MIFSNRKSKIENRKLKVGLVFLLAGTLALVTTSCAPKASRTASETGKVNYNQIPPAVETMLPNIRRHVETIAAFGPRQTGQSGADKTFDYIRGQLAQIAPDIEPRLFASTVTVAMDRPGVEALDTAEGHTSIEIMGTPDPKQRLPAYSLTPNSVQACPTHSPETCASGGCRLCEKPRRLVDLGDGSWEQFAGKNLQDAVVLLDFNSGQAWLRAAELGAAGAIFIEPDRTTVGQADTKYLAVLPLAFPRVYVDRATGSKLRNLEPGTRNLEEKQRNREPGTRNLEENPSPPGSRFPVPGSVVLHNRLAWRNVPAPCLELIIPGKDRSCCFILASHYDARCIAPDLSFGAAEIWGIAETLELVRYFRQNPPNYDVQIMFVSGLWQSHQPMRDYLSPQAAYGDGPAGQCYGRLGTYYKLALGIDLEPEGQGINILNESAWDFTPGEAYAWLGKNLFVKGGWREQIRGRFNLPEQASMFGGSRVFTVETMDDVIAPKSDSGPLMYTPRYQTAEEPFQSVALPTLCFQTQRLARLAHFTPLDRFPVKSSQSPVASSREEKDTPDSSLATGYGLQATAVDGLLRPQLLMTLGVLENMLAYRADLLPAIKPQHRDSRTYGNYAQLTGRILEWDRSIGWFAERLPGTSSRSPVASSREGQNNPSSSPATGYRLPATSAPSVQTLVQAYPSNDSYTKTLGTRPRNFLHWPTAPCRAFTRDLQCFMFQDIRLLEDSCQVTGSRLPATAVPAYPAALTHGKNFQINTVYAASPAVSYDVVAYGIDSAGQLRYATDYGLHGDSNKAFQCTDVKLDGWDLNIPVSLFECGSLELFDLVDPQRYDPNAEIFGQWLMFYDDDGADRGMAPYLSITGVKDTDSHTDMERWGCTQQGPFAMVFLPAGSSLGSEILLGTWFKNFTVLTNRSSQSPVASSRQDKSSQYPVASSREGRETASSLLATDYRLPATSSTGGYRLSSGQTTSLSRDDRPTAQACVEQLTALNQQRMADFARYDVASPLAKKHHADSVAALEAAKEAQAAGDPQAARAHQMRGWIHESLAYRSTVSLLLDVVSTTVFYFVMLIPFSFLVERLVFPQRTVIRTGIVAATIFALFAGLLYLFHPGFKLANNVIVTIAAFIIVVMTIPALLLLLFRGVAMLRAIGSKAVITQRSEAESAGVVMAALSLAVSNMRRRRLRTALTLLTITALVVALVLLTTSSAFELELSEPTQLTNSSVEGIQIYNLTDHRKALLKEMVEIYEAAVPRIARQENSQSQSASDTAIVVANSATPMTVAPASQPATASPEWLVIRRECVNYGHDFTMAADNGALLLKAGDPAGMGKTVPVPFFQVMDERDNLVEYNLDESGQRKKLHLGELITGKFLEAGDRDVCLLPNNMAEALGVGVGDTVSVMGLPLKVKGIWQAVVKKKQTDPKTGKETEIELPGNWDRLSDLDGMGITAMPIYREGEPDRPTRAASRQIVIIPRKWLETYRPFPSTVLSLLIVPRDGKDLDTRLKSLAGSLAQEILNVDVYSYFFGAGGQPVSSRISRQTSTQVKGSSMMLVLMGVAVLMILAIMTGTVYERMREIHIFSSVGLSPRHVAGMFLIEALVYAGIAAVAGYFLGIIALRVLLDHLKATGQGQDFYPNYLGVFVLYSIGTAVLGTLLSSIYPIRLAGRIVNPSDGKTWQSDAVGDDHWDIRLPFIATTWDEARAMMVYAYDYLAIHQGERSGRFVCQKPPAGKMAGTSIELAMPVWLAPFERNLTQQVLLRAAPTANGQWWELSLTLDRLSGPPYLWKRGAKVFVDALCKHLLRWRAATGEQETECLARAETVLESV